MIPSVDALVSGVLINTNGNSTQVIAAQTGYKLFVTEIHITNTSAGFVTVDIRDGVGGTVLWTVGVPASGSATVSFRNALGGFTENTGIFADPSGATTTLTISINGFKKKTY